ncbi:MAG TPA: protein kinase [Polyangiaceae bacterium]|nr:protein kinase [Polyangiaceae bacterium]
MIERTRQPPPARDDEAMASVLPKAGHAVELAATRISVEPGRQIVSSSARRPYGPGDVIDGKYELESLLGRGGMGEVWTARNSTLDVRRAVKLIRTDAGSAENTDRLLHEAQAAAQLSEPAIVRVFDFGKTSWGDPYIVMEMLEGEDLMTIIRRRERLSPSKAVRVLLPVIRALGAAHARGIVHRDLKPENIFLAKLPDGRVQPKLLDFGIAKLKNAQALRLTTAGEVMGSPLYMAPEQARGEDVDERADLWAICVVLYEALTGNPPFVGESRAQVIRAASDDSPPPLSQHGLEDDSLWPIISRGLEKRRDARWASMEELGKALARWLLDAGVQDDITGASLQSTWFRISRQSLFASSSPPGRLSFALLPLPGARLVPLDRSRLRALSDWARSLRAGARARPRGALVLGTLAALATLGALGWMAALPAEENARASAGALAPAAPTPAPPASVPSTPAQPGAAVAAIPVATEPAPSPPTSTGDPASPARPASPAADGAASARRASATARQPRPADDAARSRRKPVAPDKGTTRSKQQRRSKLIDPY